MKLLKSILLEGPDGSGKSQLYDRMTKLWELTAGGHDGGPPVNRQDVLARMDVFAREWPMVRDRCPAVSDQVYSWSLGRETKLTASAYSAFLRTLDPVLIYCRPPIATILSTPVPERPHKPANHVQQVLAARERIVDAYDRFIPDIVDTAELQSRLYDWTLDEDGQKLLEWLKDIKCVE